MKYKRGYYDAFIQTCAKYHTNVAVRHYYDGVWKCYTYSELYGICEYISQNLQQLGCSKGIVGLVSEKNIITPCLIAAVHKCYTSFMFLDPSEDIESICRDAKFKVIISVENQNNAGSILSSIKPDKTISIFELVINIFKIQVNLGNSSHQTEHSFIAKTSGSTGKPKHIQIPLSCIQPNVDDLSTLFEINSKDVIYFSTPLTFDPSMIEILLAYKNGASLLIAPNIAEVMLSENKEHSVTLWQTTPSIFFQSSDFVISNVYFGPNSTLKVLALGGEPIYGVHRLNALKHKDNKTKIYTLYGVTEMSCWACAAELELNKIDVDRDIPLGNCLSETEVTVKPTKANSNTGNIVLASKTRKCIILNRPENKDEKYSIKCIDTGDLGEVKNGIVYYRGRTDDVVKRFGHKVSLHDIEKTIMQCPEVKCCSCIWLPKPLLLVVYYSSESLSSKELSDFLRCKLDQKLWPDKVIRVDNLPTSKHGKLSKELICKLYKPKQKVNYTLDTLKLEFLNELKTIIGGNIRNYDDIKDKEFSALGGTSFLAVSICNKLSVSYPEFGRLILPYLVSQKRTIEEIMQIVQNEFDKNPNKKLLKRIKPTASCSDSVVIPSKRVSSNNFGSQFSKLEFKKVWSQNTGKCIDATPSLFYVGSNLFVTVGSHSGKVIVVNAGDGALIGAVSVESRVEASVYCFHSESKQPCGIVGSYDGTVVCFTLDSCDRIWTANFGAMIKSKACGHNGVCYVAAYDGIIRTVNVSTGEIKNTIEIGPISADLVLAKNEFVMIGTLSGVCAAVHAPTNSLAWSSKLGSPIFASPVVYNDGKYAVFAEVKGVIHCRTVEKGIKIWRYEDAKGNIYSSIHVKKINNLKWQLTFGCHDQNVYSLIIKNSKPLLYWKTKMTSPVFSTPCALSDKVLIAVSNDGKLSAISFRNGANLAQYQLPMESFSSPVTFSDYIFIGCRNDDLFALKFFAY